MNIAIVVAAGQGLRMQTRRRKQFLYLADSPILTHTVCAFDQCEAIDHLIVVIPKEEIGYCRDHVIEPAGLADRVTLVNGGQRRQDSVFNGLKAISDDQGIVLIHDGVRPLITSDLIVACIMGAKRWGCCIPAIRPVDTPKQVLEGDIIHQTLARDTLYLAQTPQAFQLPTIRKAHMAARDNDWEATDDASLVERMGTKVHLIPGSQENIKITTVEDLTLAEYYLSQR